MNATFRLNIDDLDPTLIEKLKAMFKHRPIEIAVLDQDETEFLLSDEDRRKRILEAIQDIERGDNLVAFDPKMFD
jgi:hypothetical protein